MDREENCTDIYIYIYIYISTCPQMLETGHNNCALTFSNRDYTSQNISFCCSMCDNLWIRNHPLIETFVV